MCSSDLLTEVGPRDGLQTVSAAISSERKIEIISRLVDAGLKQIQVTSFVHPKWVPQMADAEQVCAGLPEIDGEALKLGSRVRHG